MDYKQNILIVDDRPENLIALESLLEAPERVIVRAGSGEEALERMLEYEFSLVLMDVQMPGMDGFETVELIRGFERTRYVPVIFVTAISKEQKHIFKGYEVGAVDYLFKPIDPMVLKSKVAVFLELDSKKKELQSALETIEAQHNEMRQKRNELQAALDEISSLIQQVAQSKGYSIRFSNPNLKKCYEVMECRKVECPCFGKEPMRCWQVAGTYCLGEVRGNFAEKISSCRECPTYKESTSNFIYQLGEHFNNMMNILETQHHELEKSYADLKTTQSQLLQQEKMASVGQLAAGVAHEINNPTGFIMSNLTSLRKYAGRLLEFVTVQSEALDLVEGNDGKLAGELISEVREKRRVLKIDRVVEDMGRLIDESYDGAERVKKIVENLKSFSRLDEAESKMTDINAALENTIGIAWNEIKYKAVINRDYGEIPHTFCHSGGLNQVFLNLLINAAQAIDKEGVITVKSWQEGESIFVSIGDTGCGIPEEIRRRIFEPFFTTKEVGKGTGLGLSIVYDIVKKGDGRISVESEEGKGSIFTVEIPLLTGL